jgi:catechol 2,3-dioxygenase-like lactoylglutathione lyase family enzyme
MIRFNHTIVIAEDKEASASFFAGIFGLPGPDHWGPFAIVRLDDGVSIDFADYGGDEQGPAEHEPIVPQHYAFLVTEDDFDGIFERIRAAGIEFWPEPTRENQGTINHHDGGRGVYFCDPAGHFLEAITRPYGSGSGSG